MYALYTLACTVGLAAAPLGAGWGMQILGFNAATRVAAACATLVAVPVLLACRRRPARQPAAVETSSGLQRRF